MNATLPLALLALVLAAPAVAHAEPVPEAMLDKDYASCMGGEDAPKDPQRSAYCNCVRDGLRGWDLDAYKATAMQESKDAGTQQVPPQLGELAKACIAKVLK